MKKFNEFYAVVARGGVAQRIYGVFRHLAEAQEAADEAEQREVTISDGYHSVSILKVPLGRLSDPEIRTNPKFPKQFGTTEPEEVRRRPLNNPAANTGT